jgi:thiamine biosynthesis lipoprotein
MPVAPAWSDTTFACMGSTARLLILGGPSALQDQARRRLVELETRWSRFIHNSELCRLNAAAGAPVVVSADTFAVIELAVAAWRATGGRFDPTVLDALELAGYDRDFGQIAVSPGNDAFSPNGPARPEGARHATPGCGEIELDRLVSAIRLPRGVHLDLGGIGKGHAADVLAAELADTGADGVCVNLGGDVRVAGVAPEAEGWHVDLDPALTPAGESARSFRLGAGAVATSTRLRRRWTRAGEPQHHIIDPGTSRPAWNGLATVTVLADRASWAEMLAKSAFVAGPVAGAELLRAHHVTGLFVRDDGRVEELAGLEAFVS